MTLDEAIAAGKEIRTRDQKGCVRSKAQRERETRAKATRSYKNEKARSRLAPSGREQNNRRHRIWDKDLRLTSVPTSYTDWLRQVPQRENAMTDVYHLYAIRLPVNDYAIAYIGVTELDYGRWADHAKGSKFIGLSGS